jgi:hypothetical protein
MKARTLKTFGMKGIVKRETEQQKGNKERDEV